MKEEVKQIWIDALTSGEYNQGVGSLKPTPNTFCCLGVLVDLYAKETGNIPLNWNISDFKSDEMICLVPKVVAEWAEVPDEVCRLDIDSGRRSLARINDYGTPFSKIAEIIEENF